MTIETPARSADTTLVRRPAVGAALSEAAAKLLYRDREGKPYSPVQIDLVIALCGKYGLVPELGHLALIRDRPYVTNAGLIHKAQSAGDCDGMEPRPASGEERAAYLPGGDDGKTQVWRAEVWRRGRARPFVGWGKAKPGESGAAGSNPHEMAATRAVNRALRLAYDVGITSLEELAEEQVVVRETNRRTGEIAERRQASLPAKGGARAGNGSDTLFPQERVAGLQAQVVRLARGQGVDEPTARAWMDGELAAAGGTWHQLTVGAANALLSAARNSDFSGQVPPEPGEGRDEPGGPEPRSWEAVAEEA